MTTTAYSGWAIVEQMGFRRTVAKVSEVEMYGAKMIRMDVPTFDGALNDGAPVEFVTRFAGGASLYGVTPIDEAVAVDMARDQSDPRPVQPTRYRITHDPGLPDPIPQDSDGAEYPPRTPIDADDEIQF